MIGKRRRQRAESGSRGRLSAKPRREQPGREVPWPALRANPHRVAENHRGPGIGRRSGIVRFWRHRAVT